MWDVDYLLNSFFVVWKAGLGALFCFVVKLQRRTVLGSGPWYNADRSGKKHIDVTIKIQNSMICPKSKLFDLQTHFALPSLNLTPGQNVKLHTNPQIYGITWWSQGPINMTIPYAYIVGLSNIKHVEIWIDHFRGIHFQFETFKSWCVFVSPIGEIHRF